MTARAQPVPIACTLGPSSSRDRLDRWAALNAAFRLDSTRGHDTYVVRYRATPESHAELDALVAGERKCCGFVEWATEDADGELRLRIQGSEAAVDGALFVVDAPARRAGEDGRSP